MSTPSRLRRRQPKPGGTEKSSAKARLPTGSQAIRTLVRKLRDQGEIRACCEAGKKDQLKARQRWGKFPRHCRPSTLRRRRSSPNSDRSGGRVQRGAIPKWANKHLWRVLLEASWSEHHRPNGMGFLLRRQKNPALSDEVKAIPSAAVARIDSSFPFRNKV